MHAFHSAAICPKFQNHVQLPQAPSSANNHLGHDRPTSTAYVSTLERICKSSKKHTYKIQKVSEHSIHELHLQEYNVHTYNMITLLMIHVLCAYICSLHSAYHVHIHVHMHFFRFNYDPSVEVPPKHYLATDAVGKDRHKFFRRPIIPFLPQMPPSVVLAPQQ